MYANAGDWKEECMRKIQQRLRALVPMAALVLAACSDSIGPEQVVPLDVVTANQQAQSMTQSLEANPGLPSLELLETTTPFLAGSSAGLLFSATAPFSPGADGQGLVERMQRMQAAAGPYLGSAEPAVILPADLLGVTMVYNPDTGEYEPSSLEGAPENGVRFILYAIDPVFEQPLVNNEVGHADFIDESTPSEDALRILVVIVDIDPDNPVIDYRASASVEVLGGVTVVFGAAGYVNDGSRRLDFDLTQRISEEERLELDYSLTAVDNGVTVEFTAMAGPDRVGVDFSLSVSNGEEALVLTLNVSEAGISGRLALPGETPSDIIIEANGEEWSVQHENPDEPITDQDEQAIRNMFQLLERIEHVVRKLMRPAHRILNVPVFALR